MTPYRIEWTSRAVRELGRLDVGAQGRVRRAVEALGADPRRPGVKKLSGRGAEHRLRAGDYRVLFEIHDRLVLVLVVAVRKREDAYD